MATSDGTAKLYAKADGQLYMLNDDESRRSFLETFYFGRPEPLSIAYDLAYEGEERTVVSLKDTLDVIGKMIGAESSPPMLPPSDERISDLEPALVEARRQAIIEGYERKMAGTAARLAEEKKAADAAFVRQTNELVEQLADGTDVSPDQLAELNLKMQRVSQARQAIDGPSPSELLAKVTNMLQAGEVSEAYVRQQVEQFLDQQSVAKPLIEGTPPVGGTIALPGKKPSKRQNPAKSTKTPGESWLAAQSTESIMTLLDQLIMVQNDVPNMEAALGINDTLRIPLVELVEEARKRGIRVDSRMIGYRTVDDRETPILQYSRPTPNGTVSVPGRTDVVVDVESGEVLSSEFMGYEELGPAPRITRNQATSRAADTGRKPVIVNGQRMPDDYQAPAPEIDEDTRQRWRTIADRLGVVTGRDFNPAVSTKMFNPDEIAELVGAVPRLLNDLEMIQDAVMEALTIEPHHAPSGSTADQVQRQGYLSDQQFAMLGRALYAALKIPNARVLPHRLHGPSCTYCQPGLESWLGTGSLPSTAPTHRPADEDDLEDLPF